MLWQGAAFVLARLLLLVSTVVLARFLGPSEYGLISFGLVIVTALNVVSDIGVSQALVYLPDRRRLVDSALVIGVVGSLVLGALWVVAVPFLLDALGHPGNDLQLQLLALVLVITSIGQVPDAILRKRLLFSRRLPAELGRGLGRGLVAVVLALMGFGAWSLVWAEITGAVAYAVICWLMVSHRPGPFREWWNRSEMRTLLRFGVPTAVNGGLATAVQNIDYLVIVTTLGTTSLGYYFVGFRIPELVIISVFLVFSQVTYPLYATVNDDPERLRRGYLLSTRVQATYGFAAGAGIAVAAPVLVPVLFGERYAATVPVMSAIAIYAVFRSLTAGSADVFKAVGRPELGMWLGVARLTLLVPALYFASQWGITGVAVGQLVMAVVFALITQQVVCRTMVLPMTRLLKALVPCVLAGLGSALGAFLGMTVAGGTSWGTLVATVLGSVLVGGLVILATDRGTIRKALLA
jgi:PST family polysaccharide transporter